MDISCKPGANDDGPLGITSQKGDGWIEEVLMKQQPRIQPGTDEQSEKGSTSSNTGEGAKRKRDQKDGPTKSKIKYYEEGDDEMLGQMCQGELPIR